MVEREQSRGASLSPSLVDELVGASLEAVSLLDGLVQDATRALFHDYNVEMNLDGTPVVKLLPTVNLLGMIGFSSQVLSGSLLIAMPNELLQHTLPAPDSSLADWGGELANQLLGRVKNLLLKYQVAINLSLPVVVTGGSFSLPAKTRPLTRYFSFVSEHGKMFVRMEMELRSDVELVRQGKAVDTNMDEGELLLF
jgi:chemotaxis phosphatase CheX-like protein